LPRSTWGTCANAKKYNGDKKKEKGIRSNLIVDVEIIFQKIVSVS